MGKDWAQPGVPAQSSVQNLDTGLRVLLLVPLAVFPADSSSASFSWRTGLAADTGSERPYSQKRCKLHHVTDQREGF